MNKENENEKVQNKVALNEQKDKKNTNTDEKLRFRFYSSKEVCSKQTL